MKINMLKNRSSQMEKINLLDNTNIETSSELTLDHIYVIASKSAPEIQFFKESGFFISDIITKQPEFGTSGRILYFNNFYIEFRWIENPTVFLKAILPHYKNNKGILAKIKMGVVLINSNINNSILPFDTSNFCWDLKNPSNCLKVTEFENIFSPLYFILPDYLAFNKDRMQKTLLKPLMNHKNKIRSLTNVKIFFAGRELNKTEKYLEQLNVIDYQAGDGNFIELEFDDHIQGKEINLIKELSIKIKY